MVAPLFVGCARLFAVCRAHGVNERRGHEKTELPWLPFLSSHHVCMLIERSPHLLGAGKTLGGLPVVEGRISQCAGSCVDTRLMSVCPFHRGSAAHAGVPVCERSSRGVAVAVRAGALQGCVGSDAGGWWLRLKKGRIGSRWHGCSKRVPLTLLSYCSLSAQELVFVYFVLSAGEWVGRPIVKENQALLDESEVQVIFSPHVISICC